MPDIPSDFSPLDPGRINAMDPVEVAYWCGELGCTEAELQAAVARVGDHVTEVRDHLATQR